MKKTTFGIIVTTRSFFNPKLAEEGRKQLLEKLEKMGHDVVILSTEDTKFGLVESMDDAKKCAELFVNHRHDIDGIIVSLPNFGDEVGVITALDLAKLNVPVLVQACDDSLDQMYFEGRRDSFCGKLSVCNNLYEYGIPFTNTTLHTCAITSDIFTQDIEFFDKVCRVLSGLRNLKVAQIGTRPASFQTVRYSEKLLQKSGIQVIPVDLSEIIAAAQDLDNNEVVENIVCDIKNYGPIASCTPEENIIKTAKLTQVVKKFMAENECATGAIQCWDSIQKNYGCASCLTMSMMGEEGVPFACETDITGAITMYALYLASGSPSGYLDWNNNYDNQRDKCIGIHCSNFPKSFIANDFEVSNLDILGKTLGEEKCFGAIKANVAAGDMTFAKISTDDTNGRIRAYVGDASFTDDPVTTLGGVAVCEVKDLQGLMNYICTNGFEHHVAMSRSHTAKVLEEAFGKYLGWDVYRHQ